jgi:hypothetical protein
MAIGAGTTTDERTAIPPGIRCAYATLTGVATLFAQHFASGEFVAAEGDTGDAWVAVHGKAAFGVAVPALLAAVLAVVVLRRTAGTETEPTEVSTILRARCRRFGDRTRTVSGTDRVQGRRRRRAVEQRGSGLSAEVHDQHDHTGDRQEQPEQLDRATAGVVQPLDRDSEQGQQRRDAEAPDRLAPR